MKTILRHSQDKNRRQAIPYAWVILAVLFIGLVASFGMRASFGAYISPWEQDFSANRTLVTFISMLSFVVYALAQPLAGRLNDNFGKSFVPSISLFLMGACMLLTSQANQVWQVFIFYGVGFSLGVAGCGNVIAAATITKWFVEKRGFALGLVMSGLAVGQLIFVPANLFFIEKLGWRGTMTALSIVIMAAVGPLFMFCLRSRPEEKGQRPYGYAGSGDVGQNGINEMADNNNYNNNYLPIAGIFKQRAFWLITISFFICGFTDVGLIQTHLIPMVQVKGFPVSAAAIAFVLIAISNIAGTIITGHLSDRFSRTRQLAVIFLIRAGTYVFLNAIKRPWQLLVFAVIYGSMEMASIAPTNSLAAQLFDRYPTGMLLGFVAVSHQLGGALGSWIPGLLFDLTDSYFSVLALSVLILLGGVVTALRIPEPRA